MSYLQERSTLRLTYGLTAVFLVHAGLLLALKNGLLPHIYPENPPDTTVVNVPREPDEPTPIDREHRPDPSTYTPRSEMPRAPDPIPFDDTNESPPPDPWSGSYGGEGPTAPTQPTVTSPRVDPRYPLTRPDYPASAIRMGKTGTVTLLIYVLPNGQVGDVKVSRSSGFAPLDAAAVREAQRSWRFMPATSGGTPVAGWGRFSVTFTLTD